MTIFPLALDKSEFPSLAPRPYAGAAPSAADIPLHGTIRERYEVRNRLGSGGYAVVLGVREHASGELRVIKKINDAFYTAADAQRCFREVAYQRAADHPNLLPVHSVAVSLTDIYITCPPMAYDLATALRHGTVSKPAQKQCVFPPCARTRLACTCQVALRHLLMM